jgi:C-terminal processing protease CtpA/Prc
LTTGRYYTASHRAIQDNGIEPDVAVEMTTEEKQEFFLRRYRELDELEENALEAEDLLLEDDSDDSSQDEDDPPSEEPLDPQLRTAVDILKGILIQQLFDQEAGVES